MVSIPMYITRSSYHGFEGMLSALQSISVFITGENLHDANRICFSRSHAKSVPEKDRNENFERMEVYRQWFQDTIVRREASNPLIVMPIESMSPRNRDETPK